MTKITIDVAEYFYSCGDGCCTDWGDDVTIYRDGEFVEEYRTLEFDFDSSERVLKALGYEVEFTNGEME